MSSLTIHESPAVDADAQPACSRRREQIRRAQRTHRYRKERYLKSLETEIGNLREGNTSLAIRLESYHELIHLLHDLLVVHDIDIPEYIWIPQAASSLKATSFTTSLGGFQLPWLNRPSFQEFRKLQSQNWRQDTAHSSPEATTPSPSDPDTTEDCPSDGSNRSISPPQQSVDESLTFESLHQMQMESSPVQSPDLFGCETNFVGRNHDILNLILGFNVPFLVQYGTAIDDTSNNFDNHSLMRARADTMYTAYATNICNANMGTDYLLPVNEEEKDRLGIAHVLWENEIDLSVTNLPDGELLDL